MPVTRRQIVGRGLAGRCPNCGGHTLFAAGARFTIHERCANCGLGFNRGEGFFLGPLVINYTVTVIVFIIPVILLNVHGVISTKAAIVATGGGALLIPILLYRRSWSWWLMTYFYFLPQKLSGNVDVQHEGGEE